MAPYPEEVDVFSIPHLRMKSLVDDYYDLLSNTNFSCELELQMLLQNLSNTFNEFKRHEKIENEYIMSRLQSKLRALSIHNTAVCNCHKDNRLSDILSLVQLGYQCLHRPKPEITFYALQLKQALEAFTENFIPHMKEEEEVFQPLLMKYFTYDELRELKKLVIEEHMKNQPEKHVKDLQDTDPLKKTSCEDSIESHAVLPPEILLNIFSYLGAQDLGRCAQVCRQWSDLSMDPYLWKQVLPVHWAKGDWSFHYDESAAGAGDDDDESDDVNCDEKDEYIMRDEDADIDESADSDCSTNSDQFDNDAIKNEIKLLRRITKYLLPKVGVGVKLLNLSHSKALSNELLRSILTYCPNLEHIDLSYTRISDAAFKGIGKKQCFTKLKVAKFCGCVNLTDATLIRLTRALGKSCSAESQRGLSPCCGNLNYEQTLNYECSRYQTDSSYVPDNERQMDSDSDLAVPASNGVIVLENINDFSCCDDDSRSNGSYDDSNDCTSCLLYDDCPFRVDRRPTSWRDAKLKYGRNVVSLNFSGCHRFTDLGLRSLISHGGLPELTGLDLSGCSLVSGAALRDFITACPNLNPDCFSYCDNIIDGPLSGSANGCDNISSKSRVCCRSRLLYMN
ncbi:F-box/LRR-repeat protein 5-like [Tubulanus polymorphus]|uniref:F-box/LRR-repeat protein 5-like n=1 Tax=Tubulanus polymorphus TaxID=672921 RepID=UPI003DA5EC6B